MAHDERQRRPREAPRRRRHPAPDRGARREGEHREAGEAEPPLAAPPVGLDLGRQHVVGRRLDLDREHRRAGPGVEDRAPADAGRRRPVERLPRQHPHGGDAEPRGPSFLERQAERRRHAAAAVAEHHAGARGAAVGRARDDDRAQERARVPRDVARDERPGPRDRRVRQVAQLDGHARPDRRAPRVVELEDAARRSWAAARGARGRRTGPRRPTRPRPPRSSRMRGRARRRARTSAVRQASGHVGERRLDARGAFGVDALGVGLAPAEADRARHGEDDPRAAGTEGTRGHGGGRAQASLRVRGRPIPDRTRPAVTRPSGFPGTTPTSGRRASSCGS